MLVDTKQDLARNLRQVFFARKLESRVEYHAATDTVFVGVLSGRSSYGWVEVRSCGHLELDFLDLDESAVSWELWASAVLWRAWRAVDKDDERVERDELRKSVSSLASTLRSHEPPQDLLQAAVARLSGCGVLRDWLLERGAWVWRIIRTEDPEDAIDTSKLSYGDPRRAFESQGDELCFELPREYWVYAPDGRQSASAINRRLRALRWEPDTKTWCGERSSVQQLVEGLEEERASWADRGPDESEARCHTKSLERLLHVLNAALKPSEQPLPTMEEEIAVLRPLGPSGRLRDLVSQCQERDKHLEHWRKNLQVLVERTPEHPVRESLEEALAWGSSPRSDGFWRRPLGRATQMMLNLRDGKPHGLPI